MKIKNVIYSAALFFTCVNILFSSDKIVKDIDELNSAMKSVVPGDTIIMQNGTWTDANILFEAQGTKEKPIVLVAQEAGKVFLEGESSLRIAGEHLVVSGLYFRNGKTIGEAAIVFRKSGSNVANNCRVTNCVIESYNQDDRFRRDNWVVLYGKNNRFDHNYLGGKLNAGVTLVVRLNHEKNRENNHKIDHNYFGERPQLGSNGGETMRVGVSTYSLMPSNTTIENNYFEYCSGETEIVSIKASDNVIRNNTFYECQGSLVMRHGDRNLVEGNYFIGNKKPNTGGIRIINKGHIVRNNYLQGLTGDRFRSALAVMNGVPNSAINRYHQVNGVIVEKNFFIDCDNIEFGVGSDNERTAVPINTIVKDNLFYNPDNEVVFKELDDVKGIDFQNNQFVNSSGKFEYRGFSKSEAKLVVDENGLLKSESFNPKLPVSSEDTGPDWYRPSKVSQKLTPSIIDVGTEENAFAKAVSQSKSGDVIRFISEGEYLITSTVLIKHPLKIIAKKGLASKPILKVKSPERRMSFLSIENGGSLIVEGIAFDGASEYGIAPSAIRTSFSPMISHYNLFVDNCEFYNFNESRYNAFRAFKSTFADTVQFTNSVFHNISGDAISLASEKDDAGRYNAENVTIENCLFYDVMGAALDLYRGGNDESTWGPTLKVSRCTFENVNNKELGSVLRLIGVQKAVVEKNIFSNSGRGGRAIKFEDPRWAIISIDDCCMYNSGRIETFYKDRIGKGIRNVKPDYIDPEASNYKLKASSPMFGQYGYYGS